MNAELHAVTGAFGFTGKHIARLLLERGVRVRTLTGHPERENPFGAEIEVAPLAFGDAEGLRASLNGVRVLYNTYWIRYLYRGMTFEKAVDNTRTLVSCARNAGVRRIVHVSVTNPTEDSPLPYFRGKALLERVVAESGMPYAILRPALIFGEGDILVNNIAWLLRRFPVFAVPGGGRYRLSPIFVEDFAALAVEAGAGAESTVTDVLGPEAFTFEELVRTVARAIGRRVPIMHVPPGVMYTAAQVFSAVVCDVILTRDEISGLMADLLATDAPPLALGTMKLTAWLRPPRHAGKALCL